LIQCVYCATLGNLRREKRFILTKNQWLKT
jgi:hypothetical protein